MMFSVSLQLLLELRDTMNLVLHLQNTELPRFQILKNVFRIFSVDTLITEDLNMVEVLGIQTRCGHLLTGAVSIALFLLSYCLLNGTMNLVHSHQHLLLKIATLVV